MQITGCSFFKVHIQLDLSSLTEPPGRKYSRGLELRGAHAGVSNQRPAGRTQPRMAVNAAQHKIINLLETLLWAIESDSWI